MEGIFQEISEVRAKVFAAEDQLRQEKKNLYRTDEIFSEEREKWAKEIKAEQFTVQKNEQELKEKELRLDELKIEYEEVLKKCVALEAENDKLSKEVAKARKAKVEMSNKLQADVETLEKELKRVEDQQKEIKSGNRWARVFQERDLRVQEAEAEANVQEEVRIMTEEFEKKIEAFDENLKDIEKCALKPRQQKLEEMRQTLNAIKMECQEWAKKNRDLESQIEALEKLPVPT